MSLYCYCGEDFDWFYEANTKFSILDTKRWRKCCSCKTRLDPGAEVLKFIRHRAPHSYIEEAIYGDEVPLASMYMCEECGGLFMALEELGYCITLDEEPMRELVAQYNEMRKE